MEEMKENMINMIVSNFGGLNGMVTDIVSIVTKTPQGFSANIYNMMENIAEAIIPIAIVVAVMFFIIELCNKSIMMEIVSWENIAKLLFKLVLAKVMIQSSFWLLEAIFALSVDLMGLVGETTMNIPAFNDQIIRSQVQGMGLFPLIGFLMAALPLHLILMGIKWATQLIIYGRMIEIYLLFAISPLPLATIAGEGVHDIAKKFVQNFVAASLQGVIILIAVGIFAGFIGDAISLAETDVLELLGQYILMALVLTLTLFKSGSWAKQVVGLM